ncbi:MAG: D-cysteine desulfhydrase [Armatimonadota bacterium]|nr:D-cysteine desulfhydrase [Armatimonadota bacterium]MDR7421816.1 D-cysteine desulfhydrase [Armatimonadota bacterium]MDR7454529.1 D-cysteine desulfhydrase [Armatimonadota bacterium]MDR7456999.1 D-cysteine desulfhydrase [Armatimonadota bacterium]MDR7497584.1 D-cysteine desulfhydrase [Armatimonadota bacterium]
MRLDDLPRVVLAHLPTPLEFAERLTRALGGPRLFIKRDDCTGLAGGGNKARKLEFLVGDALAQGADVLVTEGGAQSNHCRQAAAAAAKTGLDCVLVLSPSQAPGFTGNLLLDHLLGARVVTVERAADRALAMAQVARELREAGRRPYVIPTGGSTGIGALGYVAAWRELEEQSRSLGVAFDAVVFCSGSGGTHGGLVAGAKLFESATRVVGISDGAPRAELLEMVLRVACETAAVLGAPLVFSADEIAIHDEYAPEGYGAPSAAMVEAVRLVARTEGLLLDPVYTGKAMAGLIGLIRTGRLTPDHTVVFLHTGGTPALFAYAETFAGTVEPGAPWRA